MMQCARQYKTKTVPDKYLQDLKKNTIPDAEILKCSQDKYIYIYQIPAYISLRFNSIFSSTYIFLADCGIKIHDNC